MSDLLADFDQIAGKTSPKSVLLDAFDQAAKSSPNAPAAPPKPLQVRGELDTQAAMGGAILHGVTGLGATVLGGYDGLQKLIEGGSLDDAVKAIQDTQSKYTYNPDESTEGGSLVKAQESPYNPLNWPGKAGMMMGEIANKSGSPALATVADIGTQALIPYGVTKLAKVPLKSMTRPESAPARIEPTGAPQIEDATIVQPQVTPNVTQPQRVQTPISVTGKPPAPVFSEPEKGVFASSAPDVKGGVPQADQTRRAQVLRDVGLEDARQSAITGNASDASTDFQMSRVDNPSGQLMRRTLENEKAAITNYADRISQETGGSSLNDQAAKYSRGGAILQPLNDLSDWFDAKTKALYYEAAERAQGVPTQLDSFRKVLGDDSLATNSDRVQMRQAIQSYAKSLNIIREDGSIFSDGQQAESMRKYLNENWSPQNSGMVNKLKQALDEDVMSSAGEDIYGEARSLWALKKDTLDNPKGISHLLDTSGPSVAGGRRGVNQVVPTEKVPDTVTNMPVDQLAHIVDTLKKVPSELQPQAQAALAEIKAQFAHNVRDIGSKQAGQWNAKGVSQYLSNNAKRMQIVFEPEELQKFGTLNDAGNILAKDQSYPGAFAQQHNLLRTGVTHAVEKGATAAGGFAFGVPGAVAGNIIGSNIAGKINASSELRATQKRMVKLSDIVKKPSEP